MFDSGTSALSIVEAALCLVVLLPMDLLQLLMPAKDSSLSRITLMDDPSPSKRVKGANSLTKRYGDLHVGLSFSK